LKIELTAVSSDLLATQELIPRARSIARAVAESLPGQSVNVYSAGSRDGEAVWIPRATAGEQTVRGKSVGNTGTLREAAQAMD